MRSEVERLAVEKFLMSEESQSDVTRRLILTRHKILQITQTCAKVLQSINQSRDTSGLSTVLSLLQLAWTQWLELSEELCSAVLTSIYNLVSLKDVINPQLVGQVFRLLSVVSSHPQQYAALCKGGEEQETDCPIHMISFLTHYRVLMPEVFPPPAWGPV